MSLNFNTDPYYDDFDPSKNFHRILFKPGYAVQARELTQAQTNLQDQISKFADSIFSQNTPVKDGQVTTNLNCDYVKLNYTYNGIGIEVSDFLNTTVQNTDGTVLAKVVAVAEPTTVEGGGGDPPTLMLSYFSGSKFSNNDIIFSTTSNATAQTIPVAATGLGSVASISNGVFYIVNGYSQSSTQNPDGSYSKYSIGNFVSVLPQTIIIEKYNNAPSARIGLTINETIFDSTDDTSLLDPAIGASNYQAPGADRYVVSLSLTTKSLTLGDDQSFIELVRVDRGQLIKQVIGTAYSNIDDYFAKRTYETNGDYVVNNFKLTPSANTINGDKYLLSVGPGKAYVQGYRVENQSTLRLDANRARTTANVNNNSVFADYGSYFYIDTINGANGSFFDATTNSPVDFHVVPVSGIRTANSTTYNSSLAATGYIRGLTYVQNSSDSLANSYVYKAYVYDVTTRNLSGIVSSATANSITFTDTSGKFNSTSNAYFGVTLTIDSGTSVGDTRKIISYDGSTKTATVDSPFTTTPDGTSNFTLRFGTKDIESIIRATAGAPYAITANSTINATLGKVNGVSTNDTIFGNPSTPELIFQIGNPYVATVTDSSYLTLQQFRGKAFSTYAVTGSKLDLAIDPSALSTFEFIGTGTLSADTVKQNFMVVVTDKGSSTSVYNGQVIPFVGAGRSVSVNPTTGTATFIATDLTAGYTATIYAKMYVKNGNDTTLVLRSKTKVVANTTSLGITGASGSVNNTLIDLTKGQIVVPSTDIDASYPVVKMYVSDVTSIYKIIDTKGATPTLNMLSDATLDVTNNFVFDNGQRDSYYGHAKLTLKPGAPKPTRLWILFDHYEHGGGDGYFSAQSYASSSFTERPTYVSSNGILYNLRDCLDFRPVVTNVQANFTFNYRITPTTTNNSGLFLPVDLSNFVADYSYYLGRKDLLILGKDKTFSIIEGNPSTSPQSPDLPKGALLIANITHDPYTAYIPGEVTGIPGNLYIQPVLHKRWQMSDITDLQTRVNNLEYYTSLNLVEQKAASLQIPDNQGLNRFKNGILVDDFSTYGVGDTYNRDFSASINTRLQNMTAAILVNNYQLQNQQIRDAINGNRLATTTLNSLTYFPTQQGKTLLFSLPYTETPVVIQQLASRTTSVNPFSVVSATGVLTLTPPMDNWIDNTAQPNLLFVDPNLKTYQATNQLKLLEGNPTLAVGDWQTIPGTEKTTTVSTDVGYGIYNQVTTTATKQNQYTYGYWSQTYNQTGNYLTNISILPYIRQQQLLFNASGMLINTTVNAFFDGKRVSRLIRKPNIVELSGVTGRFNQGDVIGYISGTSFIKTGVIADVYTYTDTTKVRLYVVNDTATTAYTTAGVQLQNAFFNTTGLYQNSTASGTFVSQTHYAGVVKTTQSSANTVTLSTLASATNNFYVGMEFNIVGGSSIGVGSIPKGKNAKITAYNGLTKVATLDTAISFINGDVYSIGPIQTNEVGSVSGVFYVIGGYFNTGDRVFRLDNRLITQTANEFIYNAGTETTFAEATFHASGLATQSQEVNYSASVSSAVNTITRTQTQDNYVISYSNYTNYYGGGGGGGGGCCVIATALSDMGLWSMDEKSSLIEWCEETLHSKTLGECLRRGYQVMGTKIAVPSIKKNGIGTKYFKWTFETTTNLLRGKKTSIAAIPNSIMWLTTLMVVGSVVSTKYANNCWKSLYK